MNFLRGILRLWVYEQVFQFFTFFNYVLFQPCSRKVDLRLPSSAVTRSGKVEQYFDIGRMNMQLIFPSEETKCFVWLKQNCGEFDYVINSVFVLKNKIFAYFLNWLLARL